MENQKGWIIPSTVSWAEAWSSTDTSDSLLLGLSSSLASETTEALSLLSTTVSSRDRVKELGNFQSGHS